jgi:hypothetical protein
MHTEQLQKRWGSTRAHSLRNVEDCKGGQGVLECGKRFYDMLIRAKKLVTKGKLAEMITLTSAVAQQTTRPTWVFEKGCQILKPTDIRYLGWSTAMSDDVDESQKQAAEDVNEDLEILRQRSAGSELKKFVEIGEMPRILYRLRYSNMGEDEFETSPSSVQRSVQVKRTHQGDAKQCNDDGQRSRRHGVRLYMGRTHHRQSCHMDDELGWG